MQREEKQGGRWSFGLPIGDGLSGERIVRATLVAVIGFLFSRVHIVFGARPMAIALVSFLSGEVYFAVFGALIGCIFSGGGYIAPISLLITLFVRIIIGTADKERSLFTEPLLLRMSAGLLGGFVQAVYEWLIVGVSVSTVLYGASMLLLPPGAVFLFSGLLEFPSVDILKGKAPLPSLARGSVSERISAFFFFVGAVAFLYTVCLSLSELSLFGIDLAFVFASFVTLLFAMRYGAVASGSVGFAITLGIAGVQSVSFALLGLIFGALFRIGLAYALAGGALAFCFWSGYSGGLSGILSTLPELVIAGTLLLPIFRNGDVTRVEAVSDEVSADTLSRVGTMALSFRSKYEENIMRLAASIRAVSAVAERDAQRRGMPGRDEYLDAIEREVRAFCSECEHREDCRRVGVCPALSGAERLLSIFLSGGRLTKSDINGEDEFCERCEQIATRINERISQLEYSHARAVRVSGIGEELLLISRFMNEATARDCADVELNTERSSLAESALSNAGIKNFSVRVFGKRREKIFLALRDNDGKIISSSEVNTALSSALSAELCDIEYYRDGELAMLECGVKERFTVAFAHKTKAGEGEVSGDSAGGIRTENGVFYGILCDGMGRGASASEASSYLLSLTKNLLSFGASQDTLVRFLSCLMARRGEANSTLDLFRLDLFTGEGSFIKCGATPSYVKREATLYRIASEGLPIGAGAETLGERVRVDVRGGDIIIMTSDGVSDTQSSALAFIERMSGELGGSLSDFAEALVSLRGGGEDDRTALVIRINESSKTARDT